jgi:hypothetical protein
MVSLKPRGLWCSEKMDTNGRFGTKTEKKRRLYFDNLPVGDRCICMHTAKTVILLKEKNIPNFSDAAITQIADIQNLSNKL